jgi:hypothetical protein
VLLNCTNPVTPELTHLTIGHTTSAGEEVARLALPLAVAGPSVALLHVSLELAGQLKCPRGLLSLGTAPQEAYPKPPDTCRPPFVAR